MSHWNLAGWLEHSFFHVGEFATRDETGGIKTFAEMYSIGNVTGTYPVSGSATWSGAMTGLDHSTHQYGELTNRVRGDATITIDDFSSSKADVAFTNIRDTATGAHRGDMT